MTIKDPELRAAMAVSATMANRAYVARTQEGRARLAFGEVLDEELFYRVAVSISDADAIALRDLLNAVYPTITN